MWGMRLWGIVCVLVGIAAFVLPKMGIHFEPFSVLGDYAPYAAAALAVFGVVFIRISFMYGE
jgi:hypothetical protein